jgi:hypothetical protein
VTVHHKASSSSSFSNWDGFSDTQSFNDKFNQFDDDMFDMWQDNLERELQ